MSPSRKLRISKCKRTFDRWFGDESLWLTLQREYPGQDVIQHPEIKSRLGVAP
jgi:hypothetical protein